jgi:arylsulfatase A-like enzyme
MNYRLVRNGTPLDSRHATIGPELRKAGYEPLLFGYTDVSADPQDRHPNDPDLKSYQGLAPGFAEIVRMRMESNSSWIGYLKGRGYQLPVDDWDLYKPVSSQSEYPPSITDPALYSAEDSDSAFLTDRTMEELSARQHHDWFSMVTYVRPHPPLVAPSPYNALYNPTDLSVPIRPSSIEKHRATHPYFSADYSAAANVGLYHGLGCFEAEGCFFWARNRGGSSHRSIAGPPATVR